MDNSQVNKRELVQSLIRDIRQDLEGYSQLKSMLKHQRELMQRRDNDALLAHNERQTALCNKLALRAKQRSENLATLGFNSDNSGMRRLITALPDHLRPQIKMSWDNLQLLVKDSQTANETNGRLLVIQQETINRILNQDGQHQEIDYGANR
ncbi:MULTISPECIES: flagellar protein FlgN [Shewanella]|jgi:flagella synthesis protein FlgN|uniref:Flagellar protein FlgN n=1 Tax=Shewanella septentrionalis TaxID=2952223 RepID=A0A9X2WV97_9GAMM|nr:MULTISPECIES: flagellar protein FlgN [Shewanella]AEG09731.1 FlgN family protein [Shewanella baltica BA175]AEH15788.1 FlgN family protein [Shewanella baltica OS117]EHQ16753.1 FlgN family protein [Shewanella baltica OS183]MCB2380943.1 flagellar protein FlgN [Shewanella sp. SR1]MCS6096711.1 flagellar protein FlgN [Shewanella baltica]